METELIGPVRDTQPLDLLRMAIEKGADPAAVKALSDLAKEWKLIAAQDAFSKAMNDCQQEMPVVVKDANNPFLKTKYAKLENVQNRIRPCYSKHGFSLAFGGCDSKLEGHIGIYCDVTHSGGFSKRYQGDFPLDKAGAKGNDNKSAIQATGSTISYARRYLTYMIFNVTVADEDVDGNDTDPLLTGEQVGIINDLLAECEAVGNPVSKVKLWEYLIGRDQGKDEVLGLHMVTQSAFTKAITMLNRKKKEKVAKDVTK